MDLKQYRELTQPSETKTQIALAEYLDLIKYEGRPLRWLHIPNEGKRSEKTAAILKKIGLKTGALDILIFDSPPSYPLAKGAAIELKKLTGGKVLDEQQEWLDYFNSNGWVAKVCKGLDEAIEFLRECGYIN
jgi:hypothetical protein